MSRLIIVYLFILSIISCADDRTTEYFELKSSDETGLHFENKLVTRLDLNILNYMYFYNGGGLGVADLNNDGLQDIVFSSNLDGEKTYLNRGGLKFEDVSGQTGIDGGINSWTNGVAMADINGDGLIDVYLSQVSNYATLDQSNKLFICTGLGDDGIPQYAEQSQKYGLDFRGFSTQAGFFDYDLDGDLDMFLLNHSLHNNGTFGQRPSFLNTYDTLSGDRLFRNDDGYFTDVTRESGINSSAIGYGLGMAFSDVNRDGWHDIYIGNDFHENDYLYINQKDGSFKDMLNERMMHTSRFTMGVDIADVNGDSYPDIISLDMLPEDASILKSSQGEPDLDVFNFKLGYGYNHQFAKNALQVNTGRGVFQEAALMAGVYATDWSWSPLIFDMDMDGKNDIFISNGIPKRLNDIDYIDFVSGSDIQYKVQFDQLAESDLEVIDKMPEIKLFNKFYLNRGGIAFKDVSDGIGNNNISYSNSAIYADLDNDGDYDIVCNNINDKAFLYENTMQPNSVEVALVGPPLNPDAIGSKLIIFARDSTQILENFSTRGFQSSAINDFIFSASLKPDSLVIVWPDMRYQKMDYAGERSLEFDYNNASALFDFKRLAPKTEFIFQEISKDHDIEFLHKENPFVEFKRESLIPHANSSDGPALTVTDFNGDGIDDLFIGSSKRKFNGLFVQKPDGQFESFGNINIDSTYEEVASIALELNGNKWMDLIIATGGNEFAYTNDYTRQLIVFDVLSDSPKVELLPLNMTASCVDAADFDGDGDMDLFFGARARVSSYGASVQSTILVNEGKGSFDIYPYDFIPGLKNMGMIKDGQWTDFDGDGDSDLVVAEEWGGVYLFINEKGQFSKQAIFDKKGWWNFLAIQDLDNDGDKDIIAGNLGLNSKLKASESEPVRMYYNDFDDNGTHEQILTYYLKGKEVPFSNFREIKAQIPSIKKKFLFASDFANAEITDIFGSEKIKSSQVYEMNFTQSVILENNGDGHFVAIALPKELQLSPLHAAVFKDFNEDGLVDIFTAGNYYDCNIQMGRYDADYGNLSINQGDCRFKTARISGHAIKNQVRNAAYITLADGSEAIVLAKNNDRLELLNIIRQQ